MENISLLVNERTETKKGNARKMREQGLVPGIIYGGDSNPVMVSVPIKNLENVVKHGGMHSIINLDIENSKSKNTVVIKALQKNAKKREITHVDFMKISANQEIDAVVPINVVGEAVSPGIKAGALLQLNLRELNLRGIAKKLPDHIDVDVSELDFGGTIKVSDITISADIQLTTNLEATILTLIKARGAKVEESVEAESASE